MNDLAEVNLDAAALVPLAASGGHLLEAVGGVCVCCEDDDEAGALEAALRQIAAARPPVDAIAVETSGAALPRAAAAAVARACGRIGGLQLDTVCSVVDAETFVGWLRLERAVGSRAEAAVGGEAMAAAVAEALAQQVEAADIIVLSKADRVSPGALAACRSAGRALNPTARFAPARFGAVPPELLLRTGAGGQRALLQAGELATAPPAATQDSSRHAHAHHHHHHHDHEHEEDAACCGHGSEGRAAAPGEAGGWQSFVVRPRRPLNPARLAALVAAARSPPPQSLHLLRGIVRAKGLLWVATQPARARELAWAGGRLEICEGPVWRDASADAPWGDRRSLLVFIGQEAAGADEAAVRAALASCELSDAEWAMAGPALPPLSPGGPPEEGCEKLPFDAAAGAAQAALEAWRQRLPDPLAVAPPLAERLRARAATGHSRGCPCCDPELRALEQFAAKGY